MCLAIPGQIISLSDDSSCAFGAGDGIPDLKLGPLGYHGGLTKTRVPQPGSPAIDAGFSFGAPGTDQRGIGRPQGTAYDIGAVEVCQTTPAAPVLVSPTGTTVHGPRVTLDWTDVPCVESYSVVIKRGSKTGSTVQTATGLGASSFRTGALSRAKYYWRVTAVGDSGNTRSSWHHFKVQ